MKIDVAKTVSQNLFALIQTSSGLSLTSQQVTFGDPVVFADPNGVYNTKITITAIKNKGFKNSKMINYKRLTFAQAYPTMSASWPVSLTDTSAILLSRLTAALGALAGEFTINAGAALTLPTVTNRSVQVQIVAKVNSKIFMSSASMTATLNYAPPVVEITSATSGNNLNTLTLMSNPTAIADYRLTLTGTIGSTSVANPALTVGALPAGSLLTVINKGTIQGMGGAGGAYNANGGVGGPALKALMDFTLDTSAGKIFGGGGGGGGCGQTFALGLNWLRAAGGGGAGSAVGPVGTGTAIAGLGLQTNNAAAAGTATAGGAGAKTSSMTDATQYSQAGSGGAPGAAGTAGVAAKGTSTATVTNFTGGAAGKAIDLGGKTVTITAGNNSTQIKGLVS